MSDDPDTGNQFLIGVRGAGGGGERIVIMGLAAILAKRGELTKDEALNLAAYLSVLADPLGEQFERIRQAVLAT